MKFHSITSYDHKKFCLIFLYFAFFRVAVRPGAQIFSISDYLLVLNRERNKVDLLFLTIEKISYELQPGRIVFLISGVPKWR